ncbi:MAG: GNAT family N-acetyltransferase [Clostridiaceae bacterium]|jgi:predicted N-acetyltransferase YhbS|nr:GNAT family N-acetyltransferase [Clostridiaceae bacterium]
MEGPRAAKIEELPLIEKLSNTVFRTRADDGQTMFQEFPDLFSAENIENVRVIVEDGIPVSNINYVIRPVSIYGSTISVASLGAVATLEEYRGRGYASVLLDDCIKRMNKQGVHVLLISGNRRLYRNVGSVPAGSMYNFLINSDDNLGVDLSDLEQYTIKEIDIENCSNDDFYKLVKLYRNENIRFVRDFDEFKRLLLSRKHLRKITAQKKIIIIEGKDEFAAYMYMGVDEKNGHIYDCAGSRELIIKTCMKLIKENVLESAGGRVLPYHRKAIEFCRTSNINLEESRLTGTIKIIDFVGFMKALRQYYYEIFNNEFIDKIEFISDEKGEGFKLENKKCIIASKEKLNDLIFGGGKVCKEDLIWETENDDCFKDSDYEEFMNFFKSVFPIPFIDPYNLNFI